MSETVFAPTHWLGLSDARLERLDERHALLKEVKQALEDMQRAAYEDGIELQLVSSYRNFERQLSIWNRKWRGELPLYDLDGQQLDPASLSDEQKLHAILTWSALPGASRHHWGTDMDVYDKKTVEASGATFELVPEEYGEGGPCFRLNNWMERHLNNFGFYRPYAHYNGGVAEEPWHISYRPLADTIIRVLDCDVLHETLLHTDIEGKDVILDKLPIIFNQYTLNGQTT